MTATLELKAVDCRFYLPREIEITKEGNHEKKKKTKVYDDFTAYRKRLDDFKVLTRKEEREILDKIIEEPDFDKAKKLYDFFLSCNISLVVSIAKRYYFGNKDLTFLELIAEGNKGVAIAGLKFEPGRNLRFATYAVYRVNASISRAILQNKGIHIPVDHMLKLKDLDKLLLDDPELTAKILKTNEYLRQGMITRNLLSLDDEIREGSGDNNYSEIDDEKSPDPIKESISNELTERIEAELRKLKPKSAEIIRMRFGLNGYTPSTFEEIGKIMKVTRSAINESEKRSLKKLSKKPIMKKLYEESLLQL